MAATNSDENTNLMSLSKEFFGVLANQSLEDKKSNVLQLYMLIFRFSVEKLKVFIKQDSYMIMLCQYIKNSQFKRMHSRKVLAKNDLAYYKALENMINHSSKRDIIFDMMSKIVIPPFYEIADGQLSFDKLYSHNVSLDIKINDAAQQDQEEEEENWSHELL